MGIHVEVQSCRPEPSLNNTLPSFIYLFICEHVPLWVYIFRHMCVCMYIFRCTCISASIFFFFLPSQVFLVEPRDLPLSLVWLASLLQGSHLHFESWISEPRFWVFKFQSSHFPEKFSNHETISPAPEWDRVLLYVAPPGLTLNYGAALQCGSPPLAGIIDTHHHTQLTCHLVHLRNHLKVADLSSMKKFVSHH